MTKTMGNTMIKQWLILFILIGVANIATAQKVNVTPPSPTPAALGKFADIPVSNYTGVASISIPLYTIESGEIELPISLDYHGSGIKVSQEASWVGLGWSLLGAGGTISRQINGMDDFRQTSGYVKGNPIPPISQLNKIAIAQNQHTTFPLDLTTMYPATYDMYEMSSNNTYDTQPDIFYYNFFGYTGKLVFNKQTGTKIVGTSIRQTNMKFVYDLSTQQWEVTDDKGWKYFFQTREVSRSVGSQNYSLSLSGATPNGPQSEDMVTAWFIDKVITPYGDEISFSYQNTGRWIQSPVYYSEQTARESSLKVNSGNGFVFSNNLGYKRFSASMTMTDEVYLTKITFNNGHIVFNKHVENRKDRYITSLGGSTPSSPYLASFEVFDRQSVSIKRINFDYSYFRNDKINASDKENFLRLKLNSVREYAKNESGQYVGKPAHQFTYNEISLPAKNSFSTDHWGYFNGADNNHIQGYKFYNRPSQGMVVVHQDIGSVEQSYSPRFHYADQVSNIRAFFNGGNREPHAQNAKAGILTSVKYPTGAVSTFDYELNDYFDTANQVSDESETTLEVSSMGGTPTGSFTLPRGGVVLVDFNLANYYYSADPNNNVIMNQMTAVLERQDGSPVLRFVPSDSQMDGIPGGSNNVDQMTSNVCVALEPGSYRIRVDHAGYTYLNLSMRLKHYQQQTSYKKRFGPGLRIQSIDTRESQTASLRKKRVYTYQESGGESTGRLMGQLQYFYNATKMFSSLIQGPTYDNNCCYLSSLVPYVSPQGALYSIVVTSNSVQPVSSSAQGNSVGYNFVTVAEENELGVRLGKSVYHYDNNQDIPYPIFLPGVPQHLYHGNGHLTKEQHYDGTRLLKEKETVYGLRSASQVNLDGIFTYRPSSHDFRMIMSHVPNIVPGYYLPVLAAWYQVRSEWWYPTQTIERDYSGGTTNPVVRTTAFEYSNANHKLITKTENNTSDGLVLSVKTYYPSDNPTGTNNTAATFSRMIADNMLSLPIKKEVRRNGVLIEEAINNYVINDHDQVVPFDARKRDIQKNQFETSVEYQRFDNRGRLLQYRNKNGYTTAYLWGYASQYPVAKIENATYQEILNILGQTTINNLNAATVADGTINTAINSLRNHANMKKAQVSTYTYKPLIGMTSMTDPRGITEYYKYDGFQRLKDVLDFDQNVLKNYQYHYRP